MIFVGNDWSEDHHDIEIIDESGKVLVRRRLPEGLEGMRALHALVAEHAEEPATVVVGIETDRGLWPAALVAAGYQIYAINPKAVSRYRERYGGGSGAKSDTGAYVDPAAGRGTFREYAEEWRRVQVNRPGTAVSIETHVRLHVFPRSVTGGSRR